MCCYKGKKEEHTTTIQVSPDSQNSIKKVGDKEYRHKTRGRLDRRSIKRRIRYHIRSRIDSFANAIPPPEAIYIEKKEKKKTGEC